MNSIDAPFPERSRRPSLRPIPTVVGPHTRARVETPTATPRRNRRRKKTKRSKKRKNRKKKRWRKKRWRKRT
jgi:hypothetical protein